MTAVKKQGCGNCWTFSAAGSLEGASAIKYGHLTNYSEQVRFQPLKTPLLIHLPSPRFKRDVLVE